MKKTISLLFALACVFSLSAKTFYLVPNSNWKKDNAKFSIYYFGGTDITAGFTEFMTSKDGEHYEATVPDAATTIIFVRHNPSATSPGWGDGNKWNQTIDITVPTDESNCYSITGENESRNAYGTWSTYPTIYYITGNANVVGTGITEWAVKAIKLGEATAEVPATYTFNTLPADTCRLKVTNGTWNVYFGYDEIDTKNSSDNIQTDKDKNIVFVPAAANTEVKLTFNGTNITLTGDFAPATPVKTLTAYYVNTTSWTTVNAYVFVGSNNNGWPGAAMTKTELTKNGYDVYSYEFAETYTTIIFNDGGSNQTDDLTIDASKLYYYGDTWYASLDDIPEPCTPDYGVMVGENYTAATINPEKTAEYMLTGLSLKKDDTFTLYDNCAKAAWVITTFKEGSTPNITIVDNKYVVGATGSYDLYFELSYGADKIYISFTDPTPTEVIDANGTAADAPLYNLLGVQVDNTYKGIVIQNGKKFINR